ncbi:protein MULTIPOLAR SPINDLE 1 isoform X1 [Brassica rapa]|uniref:protein MULTIPOLAR SPINDLE 1 isoform X1 n=1 Tax=Brassica campestris TaxID=3711 RepID=UPI00142D2732|nr:protein MULTIPOLAR SPINDLE 1 isoform X1 [Brassica rapa]
MGLCVASPIALPRKKSKSKSLSSRKLKTFFLSFLKKINSSVSEAEDHMEKEKEESLRLAIAVSLLRSKIQNRLSSSSTSLCDAPSETDHLRWKQKNRRSSSSTSRCGAPPSETDALRWKQKAKERKKEIIRLREDLKDAESCDLFPANASCKCYFFDNLGEFSGRRIGEASEPRFNDALRRRFLRIARIRGRRKSTRPSQRLRLSEPEYEDEAEQLRISIDFLLELSQAADSSVSNFCNWSHQAVDFILASLKKLISMGRNLGSVEESISFMITQLIARICTPFKGNGNFSCLSLILTVFLFMVIIPHRCCCVFTSVVEVKQLETSVGFYVQHLIRKLGSDPYIGQRAIFAISQRISILAENLLVMDPFDESFPEMDECMFILIQLVEFLICDYLLTWAENEAFETVVFEEWISSVLHARKAVAALEERNGLYLLFMDRVTGELAKRVGQVTSFREVEPAILDKILAYQE